MTGPGSGTVPMRFTVDPWDPSYGSSLDDSELAPSAAEVNLDVEVPAADWRPRSPAAGRVPEAVLFVDGVRRVEARVWIETPSGPEPGLCASWAAGAVRCDGAARVAAVEVGRGLFTAAPSAEAITTRAGDFRVGMAAGSSFESLSIALQDRMARSEAQIGERCLAGAGGSGGEAGQELVVVDGPLRGRTHPGRAVGYVKTHHVSYLPAELQAVLAALGPGQRTPLFTMRTAWARHSWYLRLPGGGSSRWSGIVRAECSAEVEPAEATALADAVTHLLPAFASSPTKDSRAPQNLFPISGLERELRRRLGDPHVVYRALRHAAVG